MDAKIGDKVILGKQSLFDLLMESVLWYSQARIEFFERSQIFEIHGSPTETALFRYFVNLTSQQQAFQIYRKRFTDEIKILQRQPFDSSRKRETTAIDLGDNMVRIFCKGAPEIILDNSTHFINQDGKVTSLEEVSKKLDFYLVSLEDENLQKSFHEVHKKAINFFANQAMRTIAFAYKDISMNDYLGME